MTEILRISRRAFLQQTAMGAAAAGVMPAIGPLPHPQQDAESFLAAISKDRRMIVHNWRPGVAETPLELLREHPITPKDLLFVRNNQILNGALSMQPLPLEGWTVEMIGLIKYPRVIRGRDLAGFGQIEVEMVLQCSGNGRAHYAQTIRTRGTQWHNGGLGNVRWKGVPLKSLVEDLKLEIGQAARFITAEGKDSPPAPEAADFEHSLPLEDVLENAILALEMNGEPIPAIHGGPVRLIVPGYYGTMNVKWLTRLRFEGQETTNYNHIPRYRTFKKPITPGTSPLITLNNTSPTWRQRINSLIWVPLDGDSVEAEGLEVRGVAWNDGLVRIETVEVSINAGETWQRAQLETPSSPFAWYHWTASVQLPFGQHEVWARAVDAAGRTQPLDGSIHWNPSGYEWNGVGKIKITVL